MGLLLRVAVVAAGGLGWLWLRLLRRLRLGWLLRLLPGSDVAERQPPGELKAGKEEGSALVNW